MIREKFASIEGIAAEWGDLADRVAAPPWSRPEWFAAWWRAFGTGRLEIVALRRDERVVAVVPLARRLGSAVSPTNWHTPQFELLAEDDPARRELAAAVLQQRPAHLSLRFLDADDASVGAVEAAADDGGYRIRVRTVDEAPYVPIDDDWSAYRQRLDRHVRRELERTRRRLGEQGEVGCDVADGRARLGELLAEGFTVEGSRWKVAAGTAIVSRPETARFYTEIAQWAARRGWLRLAFLRLDGRPLAFELCFEVGGVWYALKGGYHVEYRRFGPGMLLTHELLARAFERRLTSYEFLGSPEPYKLQWTNAVRERLQFEAFAPSAIGAVHRGASAYGRPIASRTLALWRAVHASAKGAARRAQPSQRHGSET